MNAIEAALELIRKTHAEIGTAEFARISGVPYTTLNDCQQRGFTGPPVETIRKLAGAAEARQRGLSAEQAPGEEAA